MRSAKRAMAMAAAAALVLTACGGDGDDETPDPGTTEETEATDGDEGEAEDGSADGTEGEAAAGGEFTMYNCEPQFLNTTDTRDTCGGAVLRLLFAPLVETDAETGEPSMGTAESVETEDNQTWTITLKGDETFHDGTPVTAQSYVDAWNAVAKPEAGNSFFLQRFEGFAEVQAGEAEELSGAVVVDEQTIEVTLTEPFGPFLISLNDTSFYPLPESYFEDPEGFQDAPVGNGPYMMDGEWERGQQIALTKYEDFTGENAGQADAITFVIYQDIATAYLDAQGGQLDVLPQIPPENEGSVDADFGENVVRTPTSSFTYLGYPVNDERFSDPDLRRALSLAIDREAIISAIFNDTLRPATAIIPPVLEAYREDACDACVHDPEEAQRLFEEAGGFDGTMTMYFNSGAGHEEWVEAVSNQWSEVLGIDDVEFESLEFAQYLDLLDAGEVDGPFRLGWVLSYLSPQYALEDLYTTEGGSNYFGYGNEEFDAALAEANATDPEEADAAYQAAEDILLADLPLIPMWYGQSTSVFTDRVSGIVMDPSGYIRAEDVTVSDS